MQGTYTMADVRDGPRSTGHCADSQLSSDLEEGIINADSVCNNNNTVNEDVEERRARKRAITRASRSLTWFGCFPWMPREQEFRRLCAVVVLFVFSMSVVLFQAHRGVMVGRVTRYGNNNGNNDAGNGNNLIIENLSLLEVSTDSVLDSKTEEILPKEGYEHEHDHDHDHDHEQEIHSNRAPGQCTTWPVDLNGNYEPNAHATTTTSSFPPKFKLQSFAPRGGWKKPSGIAIKAVIFYGRKRTVDFLDCYLQQNMALNGGFLDEVWFMVHTDIADDLAYLRELVEKRVDEDYAYKVVKPGNCQGFNYACMWDPVGEDDTIYVKIDDDIVFIHPDTIPQLVWTRITEPHPFAISANLVNSPLTGYKHYAVGAIHPFVPDPKSKPSRPAAERWRPSDWGAIPASTVPGFEEKSDHAKENEIDKSKGKGKDKGDGKGDAEVHENSDIDKYVLADPNAYYEGHPWLLLTDKDDDDPEVDPLVSKTPMGINTQRKEGEEGDMYGTAWRSWMISAQQQYSLLRNLELNSMWRYHFGTALNFPRNPPSKNTSTSIPLPNQNPGSNLFLDPTPGGEQLHDTSYVRYNLNFVALWGHDIASSGPIAADDEQDITSTIPRRLGRPFVIDTRAVVAHFSFFPQHDGVRRTDLLDRWRAFANELVCPLSSLPLSPSASGNSPGGGGGRGEGKGKGKKGDKENLKKPFDGRCPGF